MPPAKETPAPAKEHTAFEAVFAEDEVVKALIARVIGNPNFDHVMGMVIMLNMLIIIVETDHSAKNSDSLPWAAAVGWLILIIFIAELILRLYVLRRSFFKDGWNTFDFLVVVIDSVFSFLGLILGAVFPVSVLRILRLCKLARVSKVFRVFPELRILMAGLIGSFRAIFWGTVLLGFVLLVWSIIAVQFIHPLNQELADNGGLDGCDRCPRAYSSVLQSVLTFSQQIVAGDSWGTATIPVIEAYPVTAFFFAGVFLTVGIAVMNLILGVVVNVAMSEHDRLSSEIEDEKNMARLDAHDDLIKVCEEMDADASGELSKEELLVGYETREEFRSCLEQLDVEKQDLEIAFAGMDHDKSGSVSYPELVKKIYRLKDTDSQFQFEQLKYNLDVVRDLILQHMQKAEAHIEEQQAESQKNQTCILEVLEAESEDIKKLQPMSLQANVNKADMPDNEQQEQKQQQKSVSDPQNEQELGNGAGDAMVGEQKKELQNLSGESQLSKEILDALLKVSQHLQGEFTDTLKNIDASLLELHAANTSSLLARITPPTSAAGSLFEIVSSDQAVPQSRARGLMPTAMCCTSKPSSTIIR